VPFLNRDPLRNVDLEDPPSDDGAETARRRRSNRLTWLLMLAVLVAIAATRPAPVLLMSPGPARPVEFVEAPPDEADTEGSWSFTTVAVTELNAAQWALAKLTGRSDDLVPRQGGDTTERRTADAAAMKNSKRTAWLVAQRELGSGEVGVPNGAQITAVTPGSPAASAAVPAGATVVGVDGDEVTSGSDLVDAVQRSAGAPVTLRILDGDVERDIEVVPAADGDGWKVGLEVTDSIDMVAPAYEISTPGVGGPSAGLMFTLAYIDALSPGDLTGGRQIAGSGTISADGSAGPVGGVSHKVAGAEQEGAEVFIVDTGDADEARSSATELEVVEVADIGAAISWLCSNGATDAVCARTPA
jgi:PDZ domain-containing protein